MKYILYYLIVWSRVLLNSDFETTAQCPQPYNSTQVSYCATTATGGWLLFLKQVAQDWVRGCRLWSRQAVPGSGEKCSAGLCQSPHRPSSHTALSVCSYVPPTSQGIVFKSLFSHNAMDCSPQDSPGKNPGVHCHASPGISRPRKISYVSSLGGGVLTTSATWTRVLKPAQSASMSTWLG